MVLHNHNLIPSNVWWFDALASSMSLLLPCCLPCSHFLPVYSFAGTLIPVCIVSPGCRPIIIEHFLNVDWFLRSIFSPSPFRSKSPRTSPVSTVFEGIMMGKDKRATLFSRESNFWFIFLKDELMSLRKNKLCQSMSVPACLSDHAKGSTSTSVQLLVMH